jgi:hypothetical protein
MSKKSFLLNIMFGLLLSLLKKITDPVLVEAIAKKIEEVDEQYTSGEEKKERVVLYIQKKFSEYKEQMPTYVLNFIIESLVIYMRYQES